MKHDITIDLPGVRKGVSLSGYTSFRIGGPARYFFEAYSSPDIARAVVAAKNSRIPYLILGDGSNLLVSDKGFPGLVIHVAADKVFLAGTVIEAEAGAMFSELVAMAGAAGLSGLQWAGGLPGTVGGAVRGNAGAFGGEVKDTLKEVVALTASGKVVKLSTSECGFGYRSSMFKKKGWIVLSAAFQLKKGNKERILKEARDHVKYRQEKHPLEYPNAGSVFKNCDLRKVPKKLHKEFEHVIKTDPFPVIPAAYLISEAGLKGLRVGRAEVSKKHPNYIVNRRHASAQDVKMLIAKVKREVKKKFGIVLQEEVTIL